MTECILCYCNYAEWAVFADTSLGKQDIILGYTWLHLHNLDIDYVHINTLPVWRKPDQNIVHVPESEPQSEPVNEVPCPTLTWTCWTLFP